MNLYDNMAFGLKLAKVPKAEIDRECSRPRSSCTSTTCCERKPKDLSGGQRQRVAIGRAIVRKPEVFLFDEPLSNLDAALRVRMRYEFAKLHEDLKTTMVYVTHDQVEAMTLADRIVVLIGRAHRAGRHAAGVVRAPGQPVRRRLHRLAADEFHPGAPAREPTSGRRAGAAAVGRDDPLRRRCARARSPATRSRSACAPSTCARTRSSNAMQRDGHLRRVARQFHPGLLRVAGRRGDADLHAGRAVHRARRAGACAGRAPPATATCSTRKGHGASTSPRRSRAPRVSASP